MKYIFSVLFFITLSICAFFVSYSDLHYGGDIIEYYGTTESLINHVSPNLTETDQQNLEKVLNKAYLEDPLWYIQGRDGQRYPVHFLFYSMLAVPVRVLLAFIGANPLDSLRIANVLIFSITIYYILKHFLTDSFKQWVLLITTFLSPLAAFLIWPGPDIYYTSLLLLSAFFFYEKRFVAASIAVILASWHSQPLLILSGAFVLYYIFSSVKVIELEEKNHITLHPGALTVVPLLALLMAIPYAYNYMAFGVLTPWTIFQDIRTQLLGFGLQNASIQKLFETFFDLNMGLFWYAPVLLIAGLYFAYASLRKGKKVVIPDSATHSYEQQESSRYRFNSQTLFLLASLFATMVFYQTNPAWHFGTAGYGPTRHSLFLIPFLLYFMVVSAKKTRSYIAILILFIATQLGVHYVNGFLTPNFLSVLHHSPQAAFVLQTYPDLYNPTPEIFTDRTNHDDAKYPVSAVYKVNNACKKAYILTTEQDVLIKECGRIPKAYQAMLTNHFLEKSKEPRTVVTTEATFWPDAFTCDYPLESKAYVCMFTLEDVLKNTGISDKTRLRQLKEYKGVWHLQWGKPITITVPPGYFINHYSFEGVYVNY